MCVKTAVSFIFNCSLMAAQKAWRSDMAGAGILTTQWSGWSGRGGAVERTVAWACGGSGMSVATPADLKDGLESTVSS
ncbi:hypothetical protein M0R45_008702 [Rubus argutus]|uniref:Secreted protein n=1 Tax=Rubus argutus TaxID=59490 RepID=A0AAW1Y1J8_RUBAR